MTKQIASRTGLTTSSRDTPDHELLQSVARYFSHGIEFPADDKARFVEKVEAINDGQPIQKVFQIRRRGRKTSRESAEQNIAIAWYVAFRRELGDTLKQAVRRAVEVSGRTDDQVVHAYKDIPESVLEMMMGGFRGNRHLSYDPAATEAELVDRIQRSRSPR